MDLYEMMMIEIDRVVFGRVTSNEIEEVALRIDKLWGEATDNDLKNFARKATKNGTLLHGESYNEILSAARKIKKECLRG